MDDLASSFKNQFKPHETREARSGEQSLVQMAAPGGPPQLENTPPVPGSAQMVAYPQLPPTEEQELFVSPQAPAQPGSSKSTQLTKEQENAVLRIQECKDEEWYDILGVSDQCSNEEANKSYSKLLNLVHPDKNSHPEAKYAFAKVLKAGKALKAGEDYTGEENDGPDGVRPAPESIPQPTDFQKGIYDKASHHILALLNNPDDKEATKTLDNLNTAIIAENKKENKPEKYGIILYEQHLLNRRLAAPFMLIEGKEAAISVWKIVKVLDMVNQMYHYPRAWNLENLDGFPKDLPDDIEAVEAMFHPEAGSGSSGTGPSRSPEAGSGSGTGLSRSPTKPRLSGPQAAAQFITDKGFPVHGVRKAGSLGYLFVVENGKDWETDNVLDLKSGSDLGKPWAAAFIENVKDEWSKWNMADSKKKLTEDEGKKYSHIKGIASNPIRTKTINSSPRYPEAHALSVFLNGSEQYEKLLDRTALNKILGAGKADEEIKEFYTTRNLIAPWEIPPIALKTRKERAIDSATKLIAAPVAAAPVTATAVGAAPASAAGTSVPAYAAPLSQPVAANSGPQQPINEQLLLTNKVEGMAEQMAAMMKLMTQLLTPQVSQPPAQAATSREFAMAG